MTIKDIEEKTGLARSSIRFYEKENFIQPVRNEENGYRNYSEKDVETLKKLHICEHLEFHLKTFTCLQNTKRNLNKL